jgi:hypothetical protein
MTLSTVGDIKDPDEPNTLSNLQHPIVVGGILEVLSRDTANLLNDILAGLEDSREKIQKI